MPKALCIVGSIIAVFLALLFGLDLAIRIPFGRNSLLMDVGFLVCSLLLGTISWLTLREQT